MFDILLADRDIHYCEVIQGCLLEKFGEEISLELVTDPMYFDQIFQKRHELDFLIVSSSFCSDYTRFSYVPNILVLEEGISDKNVDQAAGMLRVDKYANVKAVLYMIENVMGELAEKYAAKSGKTEITLVTSASGGVGKTTVALGLCAALHFLGKKVLYIDAEYLQTFSFFMKEKEYIEDEIFWDFLESDNSPTMPLLDRVIREEGFHYLPPFKKALVSINRGLDLFTEIIETAKASEKYDHIVIDTGKEFSLEKARWLSLADKVLFILEKDKRCEHDFQILKKEISDIEDEKYIFIDNKVNAVEADQKNHGEETDRVVRLFDKKDTADLSNLGHQEDMIRICFLL